MLQKRTVEVRVDDLDGTTEIDTPITTFSLNGDEYEIDLSPRNIARLQKVLAPFIKAARRKGAPRPTVRTSAQSNRARSRKRKGPDPSKVREWAVEQGIEVGEKGRVPGAITAQYVEAHRRPAKKAASKKTSSTSSRKSSHIAPVPNPPADEQQEAGVAATG